MPARRRRGPGRPGAATAGLIVVLIATLPQLYFKFGELTQLLTQFQIADVSASRLRQYEAPPQTAARDGGRCDTARRDRAARVRYQFSGSQTVQGGPRRHLLRDPGARHDRRRRPGGFRQVDADPADPRPAASAGRQRSRFPRAAGSRPPFVYLPQRPMLFDARLRDNLFLGSPTRTADRAQSRSANGSAGSACST